MTRALPKIEELDLLFTLQGKDKERVYTLNTENLCRILRRHPEFEGRFRYDEFRNALEIMHRNRWRGLEDADALVVQTRISILFSFFQRVTKNMAYDAMVMVARENAVDTAKDWVSSLVWDGEDRLDQWLAHAYGAPDDAYHRAVASNWLKGLVKRVAQPGCKFDYVLVLEGAQGSRKSTSLAVLGGDWHVETTMGTESKDFFMQFQGKAVVEFSEGETLSRTEVKRMKAIITTQVDTFRPPYERATRDFPRRCVFAMTTNQDEYLKDETGNRRWLPVRVVKDQADTDWIAANREQLFAEAYHRVVTMNESVWEFPREETAAEQFERRVSDPNAELISEWYFNLEPYKKSSGVSVHMAYRDVFGGGFSSKPMTKYEEMAIIGVFKDTLKLDKRRETVDGTRQTRWHDGSVPSIVVETVPSVMAQSPRGMEDDGWF